MTDDCLVKDDLIEWILMFSYHLSMVKVDVTSCRLEAATICLHPCDLDLCPFDLESGVRVTCDVGYLCANFSLPRPVCSRLRPDVRDRRQTDRQPSDVRQTDVRQHHRLMPPPIRGGGVTSCAGGRHNMPPPLWPWPLTFWPWKWCPSHVWRGLLLWQF